MFDFLESLEGCFWWFFSCLSGFRFVNDVSKNGDILQAMGPGRISLLNTEVALAFESLSKTHGFFGAGNGVRWIVPLRLSADQGRGPFALRQSNRIHLQVNQYSKIQKKNTWFQKISSKRSQRNATARIG